MSGPWRIGKQRLSIGQYEPLYLEGTLSKHEVEGRDEDETSDPSGMDLVYKADEFPEEVTHRHFGHVGDHPVRLRHRKESADPLHGDEDKLVDQYHILKGKAQQGKCTAEEMRELRSVKGKLQEINSRRVKDARTVMLGKEMKALDGMGAGPVQGSPTAQFSSYAGVQHHQQMPMDGAAVGGEEPPPLR